MPSQEKILALPSIKETLKINNISADKKLGQNFLLDQNLINKIIKSSGDLKGKTVLEVGPGPGGMTRALLYAGAYVTVIEKDRRFIKILQELKTICNGRLNIIEADALEIKEEELFKNLDPIKIIANLPYNIATGLLIKWLNKISLFESMILMFQKEVAERIVAKPKTKSYGRISIFSQWLCEIDLQFNIKPEAFFPPPKVISSVITLLPRKEPLAKANRVVLEKICKTTFGQRRKTLKSSLKQITTNPETALQAAYIEPSRRPEELSVEEFCTLSRAFEYWYLEKS